MDIWYTVPKSVQRNTHLRRIEAAGIPFKVMGYVWGGKRINVVVDSQYEDKMRELGYPKSRDMNKLEREHRERYE